MQYKKYDIIGDIHGCADQLEALLTKLGYSNDGDAHKHPERTAVFLGDFIDRGPDQRGVLDIVRPMIENGHALSVMGNHEFNAICYASQSEQGYIRPHNDKNTRQHQAFLDEYPFGSPEHHDTINWFKTLPVYLDLEGIGVVHACWCEESFAEIRPFLNGDNTMTEAAYQEYADDTSRFYRTIERVLKGPEHELPEELHFHDKDGHKRENARIRWWEAENAPASERLEFAGTDLSQKQKEILNASPITNTFNVPAKPVFVGHYWMNGIPEALSQKVACVDYSVAKGGKMTAYQWDGEDRIVQQHFTWV